DQDRGERARWVVQGFLDAFKPELKPLLTVRSTHFDDYSWLTIDVLPWEPRHIRTYLRKYFASKPKIDQKLWNALAQDTSLLDLCRRPMHLHMQCELAEAGFLPIATDRASIYLAHLWLRLRRGLGQFGGKTADDRLSGNDLLTVQDRKDILNTRPSQISANDLRRLPVQGLLLRGLIDQAENQYWRDAECGRQQQERCKVAVEVDDLTLTDNTGTPVDEGLKKRWLHACVALGFVETNARETTMAFSHQSWGEFFAALRLLDTPPDELAAQVKAGVPGAQQKWERAMVRPFAHLNIPVSAEAERQALRERLNQRWAEALPHLKALLRQNSGWVSVNMIDFKLAKEHIAVCGYADDEEVARYYAEDTLKGLLRFDADTRRVSASLEQHVKQGLIVDRVGPLADLHWTDDPEVWEYLLTNNLTSCFREKIWQHLRSGNEQMPALDEHVLQDLIEDRAHMALPPLSDFQELVTLALQSLAQPQTLAWLAAWLASPPHPQAWRVLAPAVLPLRRQLEPPKKPNQLRYPQDAPVIPRFSGVATLGMWQQPHPLLQHLRRLLLLASIDTGFTAQPRAQAAGLLTALADPIAGLAPPIAAAWQQQLTSAFKNRGLDVLLRLQAGLLLGELGDNIRYECLTKNVDVNGQIRPRTGIRLKATHWSYLPGSGPNVSHHIGDNRFRGNPERELLAGALQDVRFANTPVVVMQWLAYVDDQHAQGRPVVPLSALNYPRLSNPLLPITTLDWFDAQDFTDWATPLHADLFPELNAQDQVPALNLPTVVQHEAAVRYAPATFETVAQSRWPHDPEDQRDPEDMPRDLFNHSNTRWDAPAPVGVFTTALTPSGIEAMGNISTWCANEYNNDKSTDVTKAITRSQVIARSAVARLDHRVSGNAGILKYRGFPLLSVSGGSYLHPAGLAQTAFHYGLPPEFVRHSDLGLRWLLC
ncbi:MAG: SUMF1/EgtB/PvdO family nonheme iron enzyme, partial [Rugosibacter sp.]|nr:SUMF1/EgtB/PvdO family nonheme iron enzyme [Rugosibacter sp.]